MRCKIKWRSILRRRIKEIVSDEELKALKYMSKRTVTINLEMRNFEYVIWVGGTRGNGMRISCMLDRGGRVRHGVHKGRCFGLRLRRNIKIPRSRKIQHINL